MTKRMRSAGILGLLAAVTLSVCAGCAPVRCDMSVLDRVDIDLVMDNLRHLSEDIGARPAGSPQEREAAGFIAREFESYGYDVEIQEFPIRAGVFGSLRVLEPSEKVINISLVRISDVPAMEYPLLAYEEGITGVLVESGAGAVDHFPPNVAGQIALVTRSDKPVEEVVANAAEAGAAAVLLANTTWRRWGVRLDEADIPAATLNSDAADLLRGMEGPVTVNLRADYGDVSWNVIATRKVPDQPDAPAVVFSAHFDSVEQAPGASDNGSGTVAIMELARIYADVPVDVELRFAAVGAEEIGLVGARHYVQELPEEERARIIANYNLDMVGTAGEEQTTLYVTTVDGEENAVTRSAQIAVEKLGFPADIVDTPVRFGSSDHVAFHRGGIPAALFIYGAPGGMSHRALEPWYHTPRDDMERISQNRLLTAIQIVGAAALELVCEGAPLRQ